MCPAEREGLGSIRAAAVSQDVISASEGPPAGCGECSGTHSHRWRGGPASCPRCRGVMCCCTSCCTLTEAGLRPA